MYYNDTVKDKKEEDRLLIAKINDKINFCNSRNKITYTDFMQLNEKSLAQKYIKENNVKNYFFFGGIKNADRESLIFYPEKLTEEMARKNLQLIFKVLKIVLPSELQYEHREFLSGIMKLGIKREKFGDIIVRDNVADIIILTENADYFLANLQELTRFKKANISVVEITELAEKIENFEEIKIIIPSNRLDNFVSELAKCSRGNAQEILKMGRVFINGINETKESKKLQIGDKITIRGKGKFIFESIDRTTRNDRIVVNIKKYC